MAVAWKLSELRPELRRRVLLNRFRTMRRHYALTLESSTDNTILNPTVEALRYVNDRIDALGGTPRPPKGLTVLGEIW